MGFWAIYSVKYVMIVLPNLRPSQQRCRRNMHTHECTPRPSGARPTARTAFRLRMLATARPVCDSAATRPSSQITLGRFVLFYFGAKWQNSGTICVQEFYFILFYCKWANRLTGKRLAVLKCFHSSCSLYARAFMGTSCELRP